MKTTIDGELINYEDHGSGPPIVLIHGFPGSTFTWTFVMPLLARRHRVVALDLPGLGYSDRHPKRDLGLASHADRVAGLMRELGIERAHVAGSSFGGGVAQHLAASKPGMVDRLMLLASVDASSAARNSLVNEIVLSAIVGLLSVPWVGPRLGMRSLGNAFQDGSRVTSELAAGYMAPLRVRGTARCLRQTVRDRARERTLDIGTITAPTLLIGASNDSLGKHDLAAKIPGSRYVEIPDCGHALSLEQPEAVAAAITDFCGSG